MNTKNMMVQEMVKPFLLQARYGIEKESQRVTLEGNLVRTDHPASVGSRSFHPYIQTDFSETQLELITPVTESVAEVLASLEAIHDVAQRSMPKDEMMWPFSMPPALPEKEEDIQIAKLENHADVLYRRYLAREYGKRKQMVSGIHFNFEYGLDLIKQLFLAQTEEASMENFKTRIYMKTARNFLRYRWLITYLFGASPLSEARYFDNADRPKEPVRSIRTSRYGYVNKPDVQVSYETLARYSEELAENVAQGRLSEEKEFYAPIRMRGGKKVADLFQTGIRYIELRNIDLNPFERVGISSDEIEFLHLFMLYLLWTEEKLSADEWVAEGNRISDAVSLERPTETTAYLAEGHAIFAEMLQMVDELELTGADLLKNYQRWLDHPEETLAARILALDEAKGQAAVALELGQQFYEQAWARPYQLAGFQEMELSTQNLLFDAIQKGIETEVLDRQDQFVKLQHKDHQELVKNGNMTSKDTYIAPLLMANKTVTKIVLARAGFHVPQGETFASIAEAQKAYPRFAQNAFVIKPKTTNYGLGITIFKGETALADYNAGLAIAFAEDDEVIIEEFLAGTEYRFFVIDHQVKAVLLRTPANVIGDGKRSIEELVAEKNASPLRGINHRSPLEKIQLGELEQLMLKEQGLRIDSIPEKDQQVFLRENSNVSTGGDSIDVTDEMDESYKQLAIEAVAVLGASISGIDLIIPDKDKPYETAADYGIIEANFNPMMHMHIYPYIGKSRRLTTDVLRFLYPEMNI
ncbi:bifunctional glutamate--cysteine ligase GshA/glutathione synthetase GshB [Enterococcus xiangfangensis]|uniref:bifunctional glutamate--cysteine ligase GshA/glutathione synthetase GshB n=1 Tax=Enterococcus xiangfangensis TaxID=1296537 RepID=UPI0010F9E5FD|nr:bifunctional glutamate--cysteine ligase GshA/glutathione synthetase GshB [Enterococcus xiangfangensis]MBM7711877.1 glutamate--cysteine ligase [Enterococcus xiangfangensis]NBK08156.1 bifunctional glutamate--cysteine ligase GshA/glutathione synthetase GshB [Enterococcus asini]